MCFNYFGLADAASAKRDVRLPSPIHRRQDPYANPPQ